MNCELGKYVDTFSPSPDALNKYRLQHPFLLPMQQSHVFCTRPKTGSKFNGLCLCNLCKPTFRADVRYCERERVRKSKRESKRMRERKGKGKKKGRERRRRKEERRKLLA